MDIFNAYAEYYNALYTDKDYPKEADYVEKLIREHAPDAGSILDLGCGTGRHAVLLAEKGFTVWGVDISEQMIKQALSEMQKQGCTADSLVFRHDDIRRTRLGRRFDVVVSLFHVVSYQTKNTDILETFRTAREHLNPGGIFIFDCWYGPAVLTDRPAVRVKRMEHERTSIIRIAQPVMHPNSNTVDVSYQVLVRNKADNIVEELNEQHVMRYLFLPELEHFLGQAGFRLASAAEWMTGRKPGCDTWSVYCVARS